MNIPQALADITPHWLSEILSPGYPGVHVTTAKVSGFLGHKPNKARVQVEYNDVGRRAGLPASFFVKGGFKGTNSAVTSGIESGLDIGTEVELLAYDDVEPRSMITDTLPLAAAGSAGRTAQQTRAMQGDDRSMDGLTSKRPARNSAPTKHNIVHRRNHDIKRHTGFTLALLRRDFDRAYVHVGHLRVDRCDIRSNALIAR